MVFPFIMLRRGQKISQLIEWMYLYLISYGLIHQLDKYLFFIIKFHYKFNIHDEILFNDFTQNKSNKKTLMNFKLFNTGIKYLWVLTVIIVIQLILIYTIITLV